MHKIAFMVSNLCTFGGTERVTVNLSNAFNKQYECHVITLWNDGSYAYPINKGIHVFNLYSEKCRLRYMALDATQQIRKYLKKEGIEVLIAVGRNNGILPLLVKLVSSVKLIYCEHNALTAYRFYNEAFTTKAHRILLQFLLYHVPDCVVTLTEKDRVFYKDSVMKSYQIYNAMDEKLFEKKAVYNEQAKKIVTVARIDYQKGFEYLIDIAKKVLLSHPAWTWDVWGEGDEKYKEKIVRSIEVNGLTGRLRLMGSSRHMYDVYSQYGLYVLTSRYEGLPMVLLEAKAKKLPIVSFDIYSGPSDIVRDRIDGYLVKPFDVDEMVKRIDTLIKNDSLRKKFSDATYDNLYKFREEHIILQWKSLINDILKLGGQNF